jgi:hypothetical protein
MADAEVLSRKKKLRAAYRASATRMIAQAQGMMPDSGEEIDMSKLSQKRQALQAKTEVLNKLDEELMEMVAEDALEEEIEQAVVRERRAIIDLTRVLDATRASKRPTSPSESTIHHDPPPDDPPTDPPDDLPPGNGHPTRSADGSVATSPSPSPSPSPSRVYHPHLPVKVGLEPFLTHHESNYQSYLSNSSMEISRNGQHSGIHSNRLSTTPP